MKELILLLFSIVSVYALNKSLASNATGDKCKNCLPKNLLRVYELRSCKPVMSPECGCPMYYDCPAEVIPQPLLLSEPDKLKLETLGENACIFENKVYGFGEFLQIPCVHCFCHETNTARNVSGYMLKGDPYARDCLQDSGDVFAPRPGPGCHRTHEPKGCLSRGEICPGHEKAGFKCKDGERVYGFSQKIYYPKKDPCKQCLCDEKFDENNLEQSTCWERGCNFAGKTDKEVFMQHCTPVYFKGQCCPAGHICPENFNPDAASSEARTTNQTDTCVMRRKTYKIGEKMKFDKKDNYDQSWTREGQCTCQVPPLMTCYFESEYYPYE